MNPNPHIVLQLARSRQRDLRDHNSQPGLTDQAASPSRPARGRSFAAIARLSLVVAAVGVLAGSAFSATAGAGVGSYPKQARFWVSITAHQHIKWDISPPALNCANASVTYEQGAGKEDIACC